MLKKANFISVIIIIFMLVAANIFSPALGFSLKKDKNIPYDKLFTHFFACDFVEGKYGWISGKAGSLFSSKDGGVTWDMEETGTTESLFGVSFVDKNTGWAVGQVGTIIHTTDGGKTWVKQKNPREEHLLCVKFIDAEHGLAAGDWGKIVITENGGKTWQDVSLPQDIILYKISYVNPNEVWIAAETGILFHSLDGGKTWPESHDSGQGYTFFSASFDSKGNGVAVGIEGMVYNTTDGGKTWAMNKISRESLYDVVITDEGTGFAVGDAAEMFTTSDSGKTWNHIEIEEVLRQFWLQAIAHLGGSRFIAGGARGRIVHVMDGKLYDPK